MNNGLFGFPNKKREANFFDCWILNTKDAVRVDEFTVAGTYNKVQVPANAKYLTILLYAAGGGGQGGAAVLTNSVSVASGGAGGGGGGTALVRYNLQDFPGPNQAAQELFTKPLYLVVTIGAGGAGGAAIRAPGASNSASSGGASSVSLTNSTGTVLMRLAFAQPGTGAFGSPGQRNGAGGQGMNFGMGVAQTFGSTVRGQAGSGVPGWNSGGFRFPMTFNTSAPADIPLHPYVCGGGGAGGVINTDGTSQQTGGAGGAGYFYYEGFKNADGGTTDGGQNATIEDVVFGGVGGNGGYSAIVSQARNAFVGGNGIYGGGGGGGGGIYLDTPRLTATLATGTAFVALTFGDTTGLTLGQTLLKESGVGAFAAGATISAISGATSFTMSINHLTAGSINFYSRLGTYASGTGGVGGAGYCLLIWNEES